MVTSTLGFAQENSSVDFLSGDSKVFLDLKNASNDFFEAVQERDSLQMTNALAAEFTLMSSESNGEMIGREDYVRGCMLPAILTVHSFRVYDFRMRKYEDMAIVQSRIDWKSQYRGQPWNADFLNTDIFVFRHGRWQIVHRHTSYPASFLSQAATMRKR